MLKNLKADKCISTLCVKNLYKNFFTRNFKNLPIAIYERAKIVLLSSPHYLNWGVAVGSSLIVFSLLTLLNRRGVAAIVLDGGNENGVLSDPLYSTSNSLPNRKKPSLDR